MSSVAEARIDGSISQQVFDLLLRTLAEPGRIQRLPVDILSDRLPGLPKPLWLALALADVDIAVNVDDDLTGDSATLVREATGATITPVEDAWIVVLQQPTIELLTRVNVGTAMAPELGARIAAGVDRVASADGDSPSGMTVELSGPGVPGTRTLVVDGLDPAIADRIGTGSGVFPTGFDTWLFAPNGDVAAISRTTEVRRQ